VSRFRFHSLLSAVIGALLLIAVLIVTVGTSIASHDVFGGTIALAGVVVDLTEDGTTHSNPQHPSPQGAPSGWHCGSGAFCFTAVPLIIPQLIAPEPDREGLRVVSDIAPPSPVYGLLRPPQKA